MIEEAKIEFDLPKEWSFVSKSGKLEWGKIQYSYTHEHVEGDGRVVNPSIIVTIDKGSWFSSEEAYVEEKMSFHASMGDSFGTSYSYGDDGYPLKIPARYSEGLSGLENNPYGQKLITVTFWTGEYGFHLELQTSIQDFSENREEYMNILSSIRNRG